MNFQVCECLLKITGIFWVFISR